MNYYLNVLQNYTTFSGRARRSEFWYFVLFNMIVAVIAMVMDNVLGTTFSFGGIIKLPYGYIYLLYMLAVLVPGLAVSVRRLHDIGKSGWMYSIVLIPFVGLIWLLVLMCKDSEQGENQYGSNPKTITA